MHQPHLHSFHIPVMGTGFTIDTPLRVAKFGITSCISLGDDELIEEVRMVWCNQLGQAYLPIGKRHPDSRAQRITAYMNFLQDAVQRQFEQLKSQKFECGSELDQYFDLLPQGAIKQLYQDMLACRDPLRKDELKRLCLDSMQLGAIEANIMTKVNRERFAKGQKLPPEMGDALSALRGLAKSKGPCGLVFSAGLNPRLYAYAAEWPAFLPNPQGVLEKRIILKVSDFRSAQIQGQFLAKKGLWVSEFRIESGINCGGHAFAKDGSLLGPVLENFSRERGNLRDQLGELWSLALKKRNLTPSALPEQRITAQGGIGTAEEDTFLRNTFQLDGTGWGSPFLLVPEATLLDEEHIALLQNAGRDDVYLSQSSPFGVPFWTLRQSASERLKEKRIQQGQSGSPCPKGYLAFNTEYGERPLCTGSRKYQIQKIAEIESEDCTEETRAAKIESIQAKACICHDLAGGAARVLGTHPKAAPAVCPGPNIVFFGQKYSLKQMVQHIYGQAQLQFKGPRPHVLVAEAKIYLSFFREELNRYRLNVSINTPKSLLHLRDNLSAGLSYYLDLANAFLEPLASSFRDEIQALQNEIQTLILPAMEAEKVT